MRRSGFYLVDLLVTMTLVVMLLSMCVLWAGKTMQYTSSVRARVDHARAIEHARGIRELVRYGNGISLSGQTLQIENSGGGIEIAISDNELRIVDRSGEKEKHEVIRFAEKASLVWDAAEMPESITLQVHRKFSEQLKAATRMDLRLRMTPGMGVLREGVR